MAPGMQWYDWVGVAGFVVEVPLTIVGFYIAVHQIQRARSAADAAREATTSAERRLATNQVLQLVAQIQRAERELDQAIASGERVSVVSALIEWRADANHLRGLLAQVTGEEPLVQALQEAVTGASVAKNDLLQTKRSISGVMRPTTERVAAISDEAAALSARLVTRTGGLDG